MENAVDFAEELTASLEGSPDAADQLHAQLLSTREQWKGITRHVQDRLAMLTKAFSLWQEFQGTFLPIFLRFTVLFGWMVLPPLLSHTAFHAVFAKKGHFHETLID